MTKAELAKLIARARDEKWKRLNLSAKGLKEFPLQIAQLTNLQFLHLNSNQITQISDEIAQLTNLQLLDLSHNKITQISDKIAQLNNLQFLDLSYNQITQIPDEIAQLCKLQSLDLSYNQIAQIPVAIAQLTNLQILYLSYNQIAQIPDTIAQLRNLQHLHLNHNQITQIPDAIVQLCNLQSLDLSYNEIAQIPVAIAQLRNLQYLHLNDNQITQIPDAIVQLTNLKQLSLEYNLILNIPSEVIHHSWGEKKWQEGNAQVILDYLKEQAAGEHPLHEAKLIFVGFGGVGKTSLVKRLVSDDFDRDESQTHEVQITKWDVTLNTQAAEEILVHIWDFGGQQIMHSTHQFFLTERSLYVLVLNGRQGQEDEDAQYWLELINSFGKDSPVIIALNKSNSTLFDVNRTDLRQKFPNIVSDGFIATDCENRQGIDRLQQIIIRELDRLDGLRVPFPKKWFGIKDRLAAMSENYIEFEVYREICRSHGEDNLDKQEKLAYYLHLLGIALNYSEDDRLKDTNILNPHWVTKGVYRIITSDLLNRNLGKLDRSHLTQILDSSEYPRSCYDFLLCLMRKFELCFRFPDAEDAYLIPNLLSKQQPEFTTQFDPTHCLNFRYEYPVLPEGLLPRFIVRTHELNQTSTWWRSGTVIEFEGSRALVKADRVDKSVSISIRSDNNDSQRRLLAIIRSHFAAIHSSFKFTVTELVPLPKHPQKSRSYQELIAFEQAGILEIHDLIDGKVVETSVKELLNGIQAPEQRRDREIYRDGIEYHINGDLIFGDKVGQDKTENH